jgi:hypothetical protein
MGRAVGGVYLKVPVGIGWADVDVDLVPASGSLHWDVNPSFVLGASSGFEAVFSDRVGLFLELGWLYHAFSIVMKNLTSAGVTRTATAELATNQPMLRAGIVVVLSERPL